MDLEKRLQHKLFLGDNKESEENIKAYSLMKNNEISLEKYPNIYKWKLFMK